MNIPLHNWSVTVCDLCPAGLNSPWIMTCAITPPAVVTHTSCTSNRCRLQYATQLHQLGACAAACFIDRHNHWWTDDLRSSFHFDLCCVIPVPLCFRVHNITGYWCTHRTQRTTHKLCSSISSCQKKTIGSFILFCRFRLRLKPKTLFHTTPSLRTMSVGV